MKLLVLSDLHSKVHHYFIEEIVQQEEIDLVTLLGDITQFGVDDYTSDLFQIQEVPIVVIPGNTDPPSLIELINRTKAINLHKNIKDLMGYRFVGLGGSDFSTYTMGIDFTDLEAYDFLVNALTPESILMTHQPPYGIMDIVPHPSRTIHAGNRGIKKAIDKITPRMIMFGHVHEAPGVSKYRSATVVNPGPAKDGKYAIVNIDDQISVKLYSKGY